MAEWQDRAEMNGDVVFFGYAPPGLEKSTPEVFVWDLDKTYLDTTIDSLRGLLQTILERAFNKKNIPGTDTLLRGLSVDFKARGGPDFLPIYFITASPPQLEERINDKLRIDNIRPLGCFYKDNLQNLKPGRFWRLTKQVGYKLQALMQLRMNLNENVRQICWGDDSESDAIIYNLYSDICARRVSTNDLRYILEKLHVTGEQVDVILQHLSQVPANDPVERIYINLATDTDPEYYLKFGRRTLATSNTFQVAIDLFQSERISLETVFSVAEDMIYNYYFTQEELMRSFEDLFRRNVILEAKGEELKVFFVSKGLGGQSFSSTLPPVTADTVFHEPWVEERVDYLHDYR